MNRSGLILRRSQCALLGARLGHQQQASTRMVSYDTGDRKGRVMSLEEEQRIASKQYKEQQKLTPKLDDENVQHFREPWQGTEKRESEFADVEGMGLSDKPSEAIGELLEGAAQALEGTMPLKRRSGSEIKNKDDY